MIESGIQCQNTREMQTLPLSACSTSRSGAASTSGSCARRDRSVVRRPRAHSAITRSLATFHLDRLAAGGLLEAGYQRLTGRVGPGAGRPARVYWRAEREFSVTLPERRYERAAQLFAAALEQTGDGSPPSALRESAHALGEELGAGQRQTAPSRRLAAALEHGGYEPYLEATGTIRLRNCPFDALVDRHRPLMCGTNLSMAKASSMARASPSFVRS